MGSDSKSRDPCGWNGKKIIFLDLEKYSQNVSMRIFFSKHRTMKWKVNWMGQKRACKKRKKLLITAQDKAIRRRAIGKYVEKEDISTACWLCSEAEKNYCIGMTHAFQKLET